MPEEDVGRLDVPVALDAALAGVLHAVAEHDRPLECLVGIQRPPRVRQMVGQAHPPLIVRSDVVHRDKDPAREFNHKTRGQDERVLLEVHPQECFALEVFFHFSIRKKLLAKGLERDGLAQLAAVDQIHFPKATPAQQAMNLVLAADDVTLFVGRFWRWLLVPCSHFWTR